jgi:hypothetical protein
MEVNVQLNVSAAFLPGRELGYPIDGRQDEPQNLSECDGAGGKKSLWRVELPLLTELLHFTVN